MPIVVEDGTGVADANSFISLADYKTYASARGWTVPDDIVVEQAIIKSTDYLLTLDDAFKGERTFFDQTLPFPRSDVYIGNAIDPLGDEVIPLQLIKGQCEAINFIANGGEFMPTQTGPFIVREKVDVIETQYSESVNINAMPNVPSVDAFLAPLMDNGGGFGVTVVRI
jgi:hypothetical protein